LGDSGTGGHMGVPGAITVIAPPPGQGVVDVMNQPIAPLTPPGEGGGRTRTRTRSGSGSVGTRSPVGPQGVAGQVRSQDRRYEEEETAVGNKKRERFVE
jgi:CubicO group peptidase (beta-lactamase class C family)